VKQAPEVGGHLPTAEAVAAANGWLRLLAAVRTVVAGRRALIPDARIFHAARAREGFCQNLKHNQHNIELLFHYCI